MALLCKFIVSNGCSSRNGIATRHYKCSTIKRRKGKCISKSIRKDKLEDSVATKIKSALLKGDTLNRITEYLWIAYNSSVTDDNILSLNEKAIVKNKKEIENVVAAIRNGLYNEIMKDELDRLETEKHKSEIENIRLKTKNKNKLTPKMALAFLKSLMDINSTTESQRKRLIQRFVKK